jgi:hypothetical protein
MVIRHFTTLSVSSLSCRFSFGPQIRKLLESDRMMLTIFWGTAFWGEERSRGGGGVELYHHVIRLMGDGSL